MKQKNNVYNSFAHFYANAREHKSFAEQTSRSQNNTPRQILQKIKDAKKIVTFVDGRFDFDALCAAVSMQIIGQKLRKHYDVCYLSALPGHAKEFVNTAGIRENIHPKDFDFSKYDLMIYLDSTYEKTITRDIELTYKCSIPKINIDHHDSNGFYGDLNYVDSTQPSTCSVLFNLFTKWKVKIDKTLANYLFLGIITDSAFFQNGNVASSDFRMAADLIDLGADSFRIINKLTHNETIDVVKTKRCVYNNIVVDYKNKLAYSFITQKDIMGSQINEKETPGYPVDLMTKIKGVNFVFFVKEKEGPNTYTIALRSVNPDYDVSRIAKELGGGGHKPAAAAKVINSKGLQDVIKKVISLALK